MTVPAPLAADAGVVKDPAEWSLIVKPAESRGKDGKQRWIKASDLHPPTARSHELSSGDQICGTTPARREESPEDSSGLSFLNECFEHAATL